jgi:hypothetical protein
MTSLRAGIACLVAALLIGYILFGPSVLSWLDWGHDDGFHWSMSPED